MLEKAEQLQPKYVPYPRDPKYAVWFRYMEADLPLQTQPFYDFVIL